MGISAVKSQEASGYWLTTSGQKNEAENRTGEIATSKFVFCGFLFAFYSPFFSPPSRSKMGIWGHKAVRGSRNSLTTVGEKKEAENRTGG
jgi:hypothetical protein